MPISGQRGTGRYGDAVPAGGWKNGELAAAAAITATAVVVRVGATTATIVVVKQQAEDNDEEQPGAVTAAEQISQAHESISPFFSYY